MSLELTLLVLLWSVEVTIAIFDEHVEACV